MKVVISLSGLFFEDAEGVKKVAAVLEELAKSHALFVVVGGGAKARECIKIARELGANEVACDYLGIAVTRINARLLVLALGGEAACPEVFSDYEAVEKAEAKTERGGGKSGGKGGGKNGGKNGGKIAVMGGVSPGYTTDAVAAILAEYLNADLLVDATSVDGVYDADPRKNPGAKKYERLTAKELVALTGKEELKAGSRIVIDPVAAKIIERSGIKTFVLDGREPRNIFDAVQLGKHRGTEITQ
ncbi:MAG: UMP kinase [Candidatus Methanophagaceae archaeon]|nr:MAG: UMP kinase [Methanophagales archaeon]